jgi:hypothetical protein
MRKQHGQLHEGPDTCHESQFNLYRQPIETIGVGVPLAKLMTQQAWSSSCQSGTDFMKQLCVLTDIACSAYPIAESTCTRPIVG